MTEQEYQYHCHVWAGTRILPEEKPVHPLFNVGDRVLVCTDPDCRALQFGHWWIDKNKPTRSVENFERGL